MPEMKWLATAALLAAFTFPIPQSGLPFTLGPGPAIADERAMVLPVHPEPLVVETHAGERPFRIEIADEEAERSRGLMFRTDLPEDHGMLFVFEREQPVGFWMRNTPLPLDLIFIGGDGRVRGILKGEPYSEAVIAPAEPVRFVLELEEGTAARHGIEEGDLVRHPLVRGADGAADGGASPP